MLKGWVLSGFLILLWGGLQPIIFHVSSPQSRFQSMVTWFFPTVPVYFLLYWLTPANLWWLPGRLAATPYALGLLNGFLIHALLFLTCVQFYYHVDRSITLRLLTEFGRAPGGLLTLGQIRQKYGLEDIIQSRLEAMVLNQFLFLRENRYYLTTKGRLAAWMALSTRKLFRIKPL